MAKLYFRYGAMGSSKTANAIMVRHNYLERGQRVLMLKPRVDNRDGETMIASRSGLRCDHGSSCGRKLSQKNPAGVADSGRISLYEGLIQNVATSFFAGSAGVTRMAVRMGPVPR